MVEKQNEFLGLIRANFGIVYKIIHLYVDNPEDRRDVEQEVLYQAWHAYNRFNGDAKFSTWLYKVCLNTVLTFGKKNSKHQYEALTEVHHHLATDSPELSPLHEQLYLQISHLAPVDKMVILLHLEDFDNAEIAEISGLTKNHVAVKLHRIKEQLIENLKKIK